jgi:L-ribulokinase
LMNGALKGAFAGLALHHGPGHLYRAVLEASACGLRWIVELLRDGGVPVNQFVATGGLPHHNPLVVQVYADVLESPIRVHPSQQGPAVGAAILGALAAGAFPDAASAVQAMATPRGTKSGARGHQGRAFNPKPDNASAYRDLYREYRALAAHFSS